MRAWYGLNQSGTDWTKCGLTPEWGSLTPEWGSLTPEWGSYILAHIFFWWWWNNSWRRCSSYIFVWSWGWYFRVCRNVGWRGHYRDSCREQEECRIDYLLVSISENQTRVCVDTYGYTIFNFARGMLKTGVSILPPKFCLIDRRFGSILIWGNSIGCFRVVKDEIWYLPCIFILISALNLVDRRLGSMIIWGKMYFEVCGFMVTLGLLCWTTIESFYFWSYTD